jgi:hypothetical protein
MQKLQKVTESIPEESSLIKTPSKLLKISYS